MSSSFMQISVNYLESLKPLAEVKFKLSDQSAKCDRSRLPSEETTEGKEKDRLSSNNTTQDTIDVLKS